MDVKIKEIRNESEFKRWFENNFEKLGYSKIIRHNEKRFPDFIMLKNNKPLKVELETVTSHFFLHKHNIAKVDEVVCIKKDAKLNVPVLEVKELIYNSNIKRISATIDKKTAQLIESILKKGKYRNKSHIIEEAIKEKAERMK